MKLTPENRKDYNTCQSCATCAYAIYQDHGYSNWTVEGTDFSCGLGIHPADGFDSYYKTNDGYAFGAACAAYKQGTGFKLDVEGEEECRLDADPSDDWRVIMAVRRLK